ncbi:reductase [Seminavis robusta]|uniref:Reductase n=1 Tax=Seminavis robusta TaxID=568900 RepID=A0A9N8F0F4_9STRA|nr:reductase [Seminavis robusta]|eukprot:Sro2358_g324650.1 )-reductase (444) ;mRNA; r:902-2320
MTSQLQWCALLLSCLCGLIQCAEANNNNNKLQVPTTTLETGQQFPMVGLEVDGLRGEIIFQRISDAMQNTTQFGLFTTAQRNNNERRLNIGIVNTITASHLFGSEVHVITKVPYTHLGYERTRLSVMESLKEIHNRNTKVHILLEWPRCRDDISWMHCEQDEMKLPHHVKAAGPPPHLNKDFAFLDSWRALEEIFLREVSLGSNLASVASIGVANFGIEDLHTLDMHSRVLPHIVQKTVWSFVHDPFLMDYLDKNFIHFQAFDVLSEIFGKGIAPPRAVGALHEVARSVQNEEGPAFTPKQVVLKWLVQSGVSVTALAADTASVHEFSPVSIASMPELDRNQMEAVRASVAAMLRGEDLPPPMARFHSRLKEGFVRIFWLNADTGEEVPIETVSPGSTYVSTTYEGHQFVAYADDDEDHSRPSKRMVVDRTYGQSKRFLIEEL